ncbi:hypothetical protein MPSEU_000795800 [Mayamaea pseudoterrestris]|nr:hypothetical protein MPSEU_000795800 [Mayamaea pseudoterrestris]
MVSLQKTLLLLVMATQKLLISTAHPSHDGASIITVVKSDDVVEKNPYYVEPLSFDRDDEKLQSRAKVDAALSKAKRNSSRKRLRKVSKFMKRHRRTILVTIGVYAFRREIKHVGWQIISKSVPNSVSSEITRKLSFNLNPTSMLKIALFISVVRQLSIKGEGASPATKMLLASGKAGNPILSLLISSLFAPSNSAYLPPVQQHFTFECLNARFEKDGMALQKAMGASRPHSPMAGPTLVSSLLTGNVISKPYNGTMIVLDLTGLDASLSQLDSIRDSVSFLLDKNGIAVIEMPLSMKGGEARSGDARLESHAAECEIVVLLESPGGSPSEYAMASQQIIRMRNRGIKVTVCVDKVAASGGYMIACTASPGQLFAAPFSIIGSIGVVGQVVNVRKTLKDWGVDPIIFRAGKDKAPISALGEVTTEGISAVQNIVDNTHRAFKRHVVESRPVLGEVIETVATGDIWLGYDAFHHQLIDRIITSDEYISERMNEGARVLRLVRMLPARYPFFRPTIARGVGTRTASSSPARMLSYFQSILNRVVDVMDSVVGTDCEEESFSASIQANVAAGMR